MHRHQINQINQDIARTGRAIIGLGCSFVQGQGAVDDELYEKYKWKFIELGKLLEIDINEKQKREILKKYPSVILDKTNNLDFTFMEYDNSFVNVLAKKYFNDSYAAINLGMRGCGNRGAIKELYFYPEIDWHEIKEIIVIYCPSGPERFDFINDQWNDHGHWVAMWPHYTGLVEGPRKILWEGYSKALYSEKFEVLEQLGHVQELVNWCNLKNAKLIITPGFDRRYDKDYFQNSLKLKIQRTTDGEKFQHMLGYNTKMIESLIEMFPWKNVFKPKGYDTFIDLVLSREHEEVDNYHFFTYLGKGSPDKWITACAHPSAKAHDLFAHELYNHIGTII